jgi:uncharacterized RDD family membrane protein YckC
LNTADIPTLKRRFASMVYEAMLLFGVFVFAKALLLLVVVGIAKVPVETLNHDPRMRLLQQAWGFVVLGTYFIYFWQKSGQTLPMQTWRIRLVDVDGTGKVSTRKAIARFLLAWMWLAPGWLAGHLLGLPTGATIGLVALNMALWGMTARFDKDGQFLHDRLLGTRLVSVHPGEKTRSA